MLIAVRSPCESMEKLITGILMLKARDKFSMGLMTPSRNTLIERARGENLNENGAT